MQCTSGENVPCGLLSFNQWMDGLFGLDIHFLSVPLKPFPRSLSARFPQGSPGIGGGGGGVTLESGDAAAVYCAAPTISAAEIATAKPLFLLK